MGCVCIVLVCLIASLLCFCGEVVIVIWLWWAVAWNFVLCLCVYDFLGVKVGWLVCCVLDLMGVLWTWVQIWVCLLINLCWGAFYAVFCGWV